MKKQLHWLWIFLASVSLCHGEVDWPQLQFSLVASNLASPVHIAHAGDGSGRLFIVEQQGTVRVLNGTNLEATPFLDIRTNVLTSAERGLLSIAFPPGYSTNRHFYVYYTRKPDGAVTLSRFSLLAGQELVDTNSEQVLITAPHPNNIHNGGQMTFGPDGYLYLGIGDGGYGNVSTNPAQRLNLLLGKILRIDPENGDPYAIPPTNPFLTNAAARPEIWAYGFRNPWRFSFDRQTGDLYIADVGQINREEINVQPANSSGGQNYGWPIYEGDLIYSTNFPTVPTNSLTYPIAVYSDPFNSCIIGGFVYRQTNFARFAGIYFYADFMEQRMYGMKFDEGQWKTVMLGTFPRMSAFGEDEIGNLYLLDYYGGKLQLIQDNGVAARPTFNPLSGNVTNNVITLNNLTPNSTIRYTLNGSNPTVADTGLAPGDFVFVTNSTTIRAQTFRADLLPSLVSTSTFTPTVAALQFMPSVGPITNNTLVTVTTLTTNAEIHYTIDNSTPTTNSPLYAGPLALNGNTTLRAKGFRAGFADSAIRVVTYAWSTIATPTFTPAGGFITNGAQITMFCASPGATIHYTTNGNAPTTNSSIYTAPITIAGNTTVKAFGFKDSYAPSATKTTLYSLDTVANLVFTPSSGPVAYGTQVSITTDTPSVSIHYTLDGSPPTTNSSPYSSPVMIDGNVVLGARAFKFDFNPSAIRTASFELTKLNDLVFFPVGVPVTNGTLISIMCSNTNAAIYYTTNGTTPDKNSFLYDGALVFLDPMILQAIGYADRFNPSEIASEYYGLLIPEQTIVTTVAGASVPGFSNGHGLLATFSSPQGICLDRSGNLFVSDTANNAIRKILPSGQVITVAGTGAPGDQLGLAANAQFSSPSGICVDRSGNIYVADNGNCNLIRKIGTNNLVSAYATLPYCGMWQLEVDANGRLYAGGWHRLHSIAANGAVSTFTNTCSNCDPLNAWLGNISPGIDSSTNIYAASAESGIIQKTALSGSPALFAGTILERRFSDGPQTSALLQDPQDIAIDSFGNIIICDGNSVRKMNQSGVISTLAGLGIAGYKNGFGLKAQFRSPSSLCVDTNGNIYVADTGNHCIRRISIDSDSDRIPDFEETAASGFIVGVDDRTVDSDGDGQSNADEYIAGTNPLSSASRFQIKNVNQIGNNLSLSWDGAANRIYELSSSTNLFSWNVITNIPIGISGVTSFVITNGSTSVSQSFYRVRVSLP